MEDDYISNSVKFHWVLLGLTVVLGAVVRLQGLGQASVWMDEAASVQFAGLPWSTLWLSGYDNTPPVYYSLLKVVMLFGDAEFTLRLPGVVFGVLTIPVLYYAGKLIAGPWAGLGAALVFTLSTGQVEYSQEIRAYNLLAFFLAAALAGLLLLFRQSRGGKGETGSPHTGSPGMSGLAIYALAILFALYTHNLAVFFVFLAQLAFAFHWLTGLARRTYFLKRWIVANAMVFLLWTPWLYVVVTELIGNGSLAWLRPKSFSEAFEIWQQVHGFPFLFRGQPWLDIALGLLCLLGAYRLRTDPAVVLLLLCLSLFGPLLIWLSELYMERSIVWSFLATALLAGAGVSLLGGNGRLVVLLLLGVVSARSVMNFHELGVSQNEDWRAAFTAWRQQIAPELPGQAALFCAPAAAVPMLYYARREKALPAMLAWGEGARGPNAALLMSASRVVSDDGHAAWLTRIPYDLFLWKRGAVDVGRRPVPELPGDAHWRRADWRRLEVVVSHCPEETAKMLQTRLRDAAWVRRESVDFLGGTFTSYECGRKACYLPGVPSDPAVRHAVSPRE